MKKSLLALAVLGAFAGAASAQSSVTVFGMVDLSVNQVKNGDNKSTTMNNNQLNSNRLGFRGTEDLGGGLAANFWLEGSMANDDGGTAWNQARQSWVGLSGKWGEIRLGRDYTPVFRLLAASDVWGANGFGNGSNLYAGTPISATTGVATLIRASNSVQYILPSGLGGLYGQFMGAVSEGVNGNKYLGGRLGWAAGPFDISAAYSETKIAPIGGDDKFKSWALGGSYNFNVVKAYAFYGEYKVGSDKAKFYELSAGVPLGAAELRASYGEIKFNNTDTNHEKNWGLEAIYNLSKRTAMYAQYGELKSSAGSFTTWTLLPGGAQGGGPTNADGVRGYKSQAFGVGVRHIF